jgi:hypothetical protein
MTSTNYINPVSNTSCIAPNVYQPWLSENLINERSSYVNDVTRIVLLFIKPTSLKNAFETPSQIHPIRPVYSTEAAIPQWVSHVNDWCKKGEEDLALKEISLLTTRIKQDGNIEKFTSELEYFNLKSLPTVVLIALLRNIYTIRLQVSSWGRLLTSVEGILVTRQQNAKSLLRGLKKFE